MKRLEHTRHTAAHTPSSRRKASEKLSGKLQEQEPYSSLVGQVVDGRFSVLEEIGHGGNGEVYLAIDSIGGGKVALKIATDKYEQAKMNQFIDNEAAALSRLRHENVVGYITDGAYRGRKYIVLEYLDGNSLDKLLEGPACMTSERAIRIVTQVCDALSAVHGSGYIHRDIKPGNIFVTNNDKVKIIDFGISEMMDCPPEREVGVVIGTVSYLAPETISGNDYDHRVDVYATGVLLYRAISGTAPFDGHDILEVLTQHLRSAPKSLREISGLKIPAELEELILKALEKDPNERFQSMGEMKAHLDKCPRWTALVPAESLGFRQTELRDTAVGA